MANNVDPNQMPCSASVDPNQMPCSASVDPNQMPCSASVDFNQMPCSAASDLGLHCLLKLVCWNTLGKYGNPVVNWG